MVVALDFGSSLIKALVFDGQSFGFFKFSLTYFPQIFSQNNVFLALHRLQKISGVGLFGSDGLLKARVYVSTELPLLSEGQEAGPLAKIVSGAQVVDAWETPVLDLGFRYLHYRSLVAVARFNQDETTRWIPFKTSFKEVENYLSNKEIYASVLPTYPRDLYLEQAVAREKIIQFRKSQKVDLNAGQITLSGSVFNLNPYFSQSLLILLDSAGPLRQTEVYLDRKGTVLTLGLIKKFEPELFGKLPEDLLPIFLASVLSFDGAVELSVDLSLGPPLLTDIKKGSLFIFPLKINETAAVTAKRVGGKSETYELAGGVLGFVVDCRDYAGGDNEPKFLNLPSDPYERIDSLRQWEKSLGAGGRIHEVDPS